MEKTKMKFIFVNYKSEPIEPLVNSWSCSKGHNNSTTTVFCKKCGEKRNI